MEKLISKMDWLEAATVGSLIVTYLVISSALNVEAIMYPGNKNIFYTTIGLITSFTSGILLLRFFKLIMFNVVRFKTPEVTITARLLNFVCLVFLIAVVPGSVGFAFTTEAAKLPPVHFTLFMLTVINSFTLLLVCMGDFYNDFIKESKDEGL